MDKVSITITMDKPVSVRITPTQSPEEKLLDALFGAVKDDKVVKEKEGGDYVVKSYESGKTAR
jgi:uncharacterized protein (UPF0210 family)